MCDTYSRVTMVKMLWIAMVMAWAYKG